MVSNEDDEHMAPISISIFSGLIFRKKRELLLSRIREFRRLCRTVSASSPLPVGLTERLAGVLDDLAVDVGEIAVVSLDHQIPLLIRLAERGTLSLPLVTGTGDDNKRVSAAKQVKLPLLSRIPLPKPLGKFVQENPKLLSDTLKILLFWGNNLSKRGEKEVRRLYRKHGKYFQRARMLGSRIVRVKSTIVQLSHLTLSSVVY